MARRRIFVVRPAFGSEKPRGNWILYERGNPDLISIHKTKKKAVLAGRFLCNELEAQAELIIRGRNGRIQSRSTYVNDPRRFRG